MPPKRINTSAKGARFERRVREILRDNGYFVMRGAASQGETKADLIAFGRGGELLLIQCKAAKEAPHQAVGESEWDTVYGVAQRSPLWRALICVAGETYDDVRFWEIHGRRVFRSADQPVTEWNPTPIKGK